MGVKDGGIWLFLGWLWLGNCCLGSGVLVGILFDCLYLFCSLYWWVSACFMGGLSGFSVVDIALFTGCFVVACG